MKKEDTSTKKEEKANDKKEEEKAEVPHPKSFVIMKKGDYSVHILIEEIKDCSSINKNSDQLPFPTVKITCFDKSQRTEQPEVACTNYTFGEHFYFEKNNMSVEQLDSAKIVLEVYDSNNYKKREDFFGIYEFDMEYIYNQPNHALQNNWLALANPEGKDMTEVRGFLKLSASVLHDNDARVELNMKEGKDSDCTIPSQIKMEYKMISFHIMKAEELPDMDSVFKEGKVNRSCDAFVELKYLGITKKTSVVEMKKEVVIWNEIIDIPVSIPAVSQKVVLLVKDYDIGSDDLIGSIEIKVSDIFNDKYANLEYFNIYGSPINKSGSYFDQMNNNAEIGSKWKGRILMKITSQKADSPSAKVRPVEDKELIQAAANLSRCNLWSVHVKLYSGLYLPEKTDSYSVKIAIQDSEALFPTKTAVNGNIEWNLAKVLQVQSLSKSINELPDIFIYLNNSKNEAICFQRIKPVSFHMNDKIMIIKLIPDPCYGKVNELCKSGLVKIKIAIVNKAVDPPMSSITQFKDGDSDKEEHDDLEAMVNEPINVISQFKQFYTVVANVYMSRYMVSSDVNGTNDPFVTLTCINDEQRTSIKYATVNGIWNEKLIFYNVELDKDNKSTWPIFMLKVMDYDKLSHNDLLGYSYLWLSDANYSINKSDLVKPKWHKLFLPKSNRNQGEILISFYLFDQENQSKMHEIDSIPETIPYSFEINILGLRDLKPLNLLPVKKSYITFDMNSLNVTGKEEDSLQPIKTQPKDCGENPTINTVIKFDIKLPKDDIFMPELQCQVYDFLLNGMINPLLGIFLINVGALSRFTSRQIDEDLKLLKGKVGIMLTQGLIQNTIIKQTKSIKKVKEKQVMFKPPSGMIDTDSKRNLIEDEEIVIVKKKSTKAEAGGFLKRKTTVERFEYTNEFIQKNKNDHQFFVILPQFKQFKIPGTKPNTPNDKSFDIEDLSKAPPDSEYFSIGYIRKPETVESETGELFEKDLTLPENITKHYRRIFRKGLERVPELGIRHPFNQAMIRRGKDEDKADELAIFTALADEKNKVIKIYPNKAGTLTEQEKLKKARDREQLEKDVKVQGGVPHYLKNRTYGKFKGVVRICEKQKMDHYLQVVEEYKANDPSMVNQMKNLNKYEQLTRSILVKSKVIIRVYILELNDLAKKDQFSDSDPYIKIFLGGKMKYNEQKNRIVDQKNCKWYKHYDILSELPGDSSLRIDAWDYDPIFSDELIGFTVIDLEDRFFSDKWQDLKFKPIEVRPLVHPDITSNQGCIYLWVEMFEKKDRININPWQIAPEPETMVELRMIIWETEDMKCMDVEGTSDIYVNAYVNPKDKQSTDVHFRCQTGIGSFNWRVILPISLPKDNKILTLQVYDNDIFASDDFICGATIDLRDLLKIPKDLDVPITLSQEYVNGLSEGDRKAFANIKFLSQSEDPEQTKFWVQCYKNNQKEGRVLCSLEILPKWKADICKVGIGRKEPNVAPYLPPPFGRLTFSLNPFKMINQCVGPRFRRKLYCGICLVCLTLYLICIVPYLILHLSGEMVNPFNYI